MAKPKRDIEFFNVHVTPQARKNVKDVLNSGWLNEGRYSEELVHELEKNWKMKNPVLVNSCTSALHLSLVCSGIGPGDEVILPAQTFLATGMVVMMVGAKPVFADISPETGMIATRSIEKCITNKTKAIIPVHWGGSVDVPSMVKIRDMAVGYSLAGHKIVVIEDAAHAFGAKSVGECLGSDFACFSFQAIKFITSGDGGVVCVEDDEMYEEVTRRKWFGFDRSKMMRRFEGDRGMLVTEVGYKYNMNDITAAMAFGNLIDARERLDRRREIALKYDEEFSTVEGIHLLASNWEESACWLFTMRVDNRHEFIEKMRSKGISVSVVDRRINEHPVFGGITKGLTGQRLFDKTQISIPVHDALTDEDVDYIVTSVKEGW